MTPLLALIFQRQLEEKNRHTHGQRSTSLSGMVPCTGTPHVAIVIGRIVAFSMPNATSSKQLHDTHMPRGLKCKCALA
jgi:hypothetical protein